jgi:hypothetical protein
LLSLATLSELQNILSLILEENVEAVNYATLCLREGEDAARRQRRPLLDPQAFSPDSITENMVSCFNKLDLLITNMALDKIRYRYSCDNRNEQREYLDQFVMKIGSSQTLARLLSQSPNQRTSEAAAARYKRNAADHHIPGSPRHLVERLMFEGIKANFESIRSTGRKLVVKDGEGNAYATQPSVDILAIATDVVEERKALCVVFGTKISDLIVLDVASVREKAHFLAQAREADNFLVIDNAGVPMEVSKSIQLRFSKPAFLSPSVSINMSPKDPTASGGGGVGGSAGGAGNYSLTVRAVSNRLNDDGSINTDGSRATGGDDNGSGTHGFLPFDAAAGDSDSGNDGRSGSSGDSTGTTDVRPPLPDPSADTGNMGKAGRALSNVLTTFFGGLKGDRGGEGSKSAQGESGPHTQPDADSVPANNNNKNSNLAVTDAPDKSPPQKDELNGQRGRHSDEGSDEEVRRTLVGYGDDLPVGDLSAFLQLGPGARIRLVGQKEVNEVQGDSQADSQGNSQGGTQGSQRDSQGDSQGSQGGSQGDSRKYLLLEGKSVPAAGPRGLHVRVVRQWVDYTEAVAFLQNGFADPTTAATSDSNSGVGVSVAPLGGVKAGAGAGADVGRVEAAEADAQEDLDDGSSSPFFGGSISMM